MSCLCIDDLQPASFRGAAFFVANDKEDYGRRNIVHEYPMRDDPYIEDIGQKVTKYSINGYLAGDDWMAQKAALVAACTQRGPAILILPTESPVLVACNSLSVSRSKDECGFYGVTMEFVIATNFGAPAAAVGAVESLIGAAINAAVAPLTSYFDLNYIAQNTLPYVSDNQIGRLTQLSSDVIATVEGSPSNSDTLSANVVQAAIGVFQNAAAYAEPDPQGSVTLASQPIAAATIGVVANDLGTTVISTSGVTVANGSSAIVPMINYMIGGIGNSMSPDDAITALMPFAQWSVNEPGRIMVLPPNNPAVAAQSSTVIAPSELADAQNAALFCGMVRSFALMKLAQAISAKTFLTRQDAIQARANVVELFNEQAQEFSEDLIVNVIMQARDLCVQAISQKMTTIVPILTINAPLSMPSLYWAARLYDDPSRAEELSDRNDVENPAFMPSQFEALAR